MSESEMQHQSDEPQREAAIASDREAVPRGNDGRALDEQIRMRAHELYRERGGGIGDDMSDWLRAESELRGQFQRTAGTSFDEQRAAASAQPENQA